MVGGRLIYLTLNPKNDRKQELVGLDPATGAEGWRTQVTNDFGSEVGGAPVPIVGRFPGGDIVLTYAGDAVRAKDGKIVGSLLATKTGFKKYYASFVVVLNPAREFLVRLVGEDGLLYVQALRLGYDSPDQEKLSAETLWGPLVVSPPYGEGKKLPTGYVHLLSHDGKWFMQGYAGDHLITLDGRDGKILCAKPGLKEMRGHGVWHEYPTLHRAGRYLFAGDRNGTAAVFSDGPQWELVALSRLEKDDWHSNPFFQGDRIYIRTRHSLYGIGPKAVK
jgi:hypothetical protein